MLKALSEKGIAGGPQQLPADTFAARGSARKAADENSLRADSFEASREMTVAVK